MPLNLQANDGDFTPYISYNAKAGRWYVRVEGQDGDIEVVNPVMAFDFANIKTGWIFYTAGLGPEKVWDPSPTSTAPKPAGDKKFKRGFEVIVHGNSPIGEREFSSTANNTISAILEMYAEYERGKISNPGKMPIFACIGVKPVTGQHGTNYSPLFKLQGWTANPKSIPLGHTGNGSHRPAWTIDQCVTECAAVGVSRDEMVAFLKSKGSPGFNGIRDTPLVQQLIASKVPGDAFEIDPPPPQDDIPF